MARKTMAERRAERAVGKPTAVKTWSGSVGGSDEAYTLYSEQGSRFLSLGGALNLGRTGSARIAVEDLEHVGGWLITMGLILTGEKHEDELIDWDPKGPPVTVEG